VTPAVTSGRSGVADVILRDGSTLRLRQTGPEDEDALLTFFTPPQEALKSW
jgi:hypothetical protein